MTEFMTPRERWLAALTCRPVDRLPFWPKFTQAYPPAQREPWRAMDKDEIESWIGVDRHVWCGVGVKSVRSRTSCEESGEKGSAFQCVMRTPAGDLTVRKGWDKGSQSWHPVEFPVKTAADLDAMRLYYEDETFEPDEEALTELRRAMTEVGEDGLCFTWSGTSPLMHFVQELADVAPGHYFLADERERVEALFDAMHGAHLRCLDAICECSPIPVVYSGENTSTTLISPEQFRRYALPHLQAYDRRIQAAGKIHILHMCGTLKDVLPDVAKVGAHSIEAFTSPPVGNTRLIDGRTQCPEMALVGGTNATLWLAEPEKIAEEVYADLDALPHTRGVVLTSAGVMPPPCPPETIKFVADRVREYPVRN